MSAGSQCDVRPAVYQNPALRAANQIHDTTGQFKEFTVVKIFLTYLYKIYTPIKGSADTTYN